MFWLIAFFSVLLQRYDYTERLLQDDIADMACMRTINIRNDALYYVSVHIISSMHHPCHIDGFLPILFQSS